MSVLAYMFHPTASPFRYFSAWPAMALLALGAPQWARCEPPRPVAEAALDMYTPVAFDQQRFAGQFGERTRANIEGYLERVDAPRLLKPFQERSADALDPLLAEGAGLYLVAASNSYEYSDDAQLRTVMDRVARGLMAAQEPDGYVGVYTKEARWGPGDTLTHASVLLGLLAYSHVTGEDEPATAVRKAADLLLVAFAKHKLSTEAAALLPAVADLYRSTGDARYLSLCKGVAAASNGSEGSLLVQSLRGYGLVELYRSTADSGYLRSAEASWRQIEDQHPSITGVPGANEQVDACLTLAWFQFSLDLLRLTGRPVYAGALERVTYNALLPAQQATSGAIAASVALAGSKHFGNGTDVCTTAASLGLSELMEVAWGRFGYGLGILSYNPGRASLRLRRRVSLQFYLESAYPESGSVLLHIEPTHDVRFPLRLYVPEWTKRFQASVGDTRLVGQPGQFLIIDREWKKGDTVKISIDMTATLVTDALHAGHAALKRGPQILMASSNVGGTPQHLTNWTLGANAAASLRESGTGSGMPAAGTQANAYLAEARDNGQARQLTWGAFSDMTEGSIWFAQAP